MLLHDKLRPYRVILASNSPRRRALMKDAGIEYTVAEAYDVDEVYPAGLSAEKVPIYLSELKSSGYPFELAHNELLITADTVVILNGEVVGKPADRSDAIAMLGRLSGKRHEVITGVTIRGSEKTLSFSTTSSVWFRVLSAEEVEYYVDTFKPYDKAGSYGIQEWIGCVGIERIEGSFYNVMGLPVQQLYVRLDDFVESLRRP